MPTPQNYTSSTMKWHPSNPSETACVRSNLAGFPYEEFSCLYDDFIGFTYTKYEREVADPVPVRNWMVGKPWVPVLACLLYGIFIVAGQAYFAKRDRLNWKYTLALWNLGLSVFSFIGMCRTAPNLFHNLYYYTWQENLCLDPESHYGSGSTGLWVQLFILSKFPELVDTFFIVIHKKKLIFLHWYHHISVLLYCWHSYVTKAPTGIVFCAMNYAVHSIMYFYYFLMAVRMKPKWLDPMVITVAQISQMVVGVAVTVLGWYVMLYEKVPGCAMTADNNMAALVMYGSYLFLFLEFFFQRYSVKNSKKQKQV